MEHGRTDRHDSWNSYLDVLALLCLAWYLVTLVGMYRDFFSKYHLGKAEDKNDTFNSHPKEKGLTDETKLDVTNSPVPYIMR